MVIKLFVIILERNKVNKENLLFSNKKNDVKQTIEDLMGKKSPTLNKDNSKSPFKLELTSRNSVNTNATTTMNKKLFSTNNEKKVVHKIKVQSTGDGKKLLNSPLNNLTSSQQINFSNNLNKNKITNMYSTVSNINKKFSAQIKK